MAVALLGTTACEPAPPVPVLTVTTTDDTGDADPGDGVCETEVGSGRCSLRAAIEEGNALGRADLTVPSGTYPDCSSACSGAPMEVAGRIRINTASADHITVGSIAVRAGGVLSIGEATIVFLTVEGTLVAQRLRNWTSTPETAGQLRVGASGLAVVADSELMGMSGPPVRNDGQLVLLRSTLVALWAPAVSQGSGATMRVGSSALITETDLFGIAGSPACEGGTVESLGYNFASGSATDADPCDLHASGDLGDVDPLMQGGTPAVGSPLVDHIPVGSGGCGAEVTDARGRPRPVDGDGDGVVACDVGAYELQQPAAGGAYPETTRSRPASFAA